MMDARADLQLKRMGIALFLAVGGQYIVGDCDQETVVGQIGTASCMTCGCWNELPWSNHQRANVKFAPLLRITSLYLQTAPFKLKFNISIWP